MKIRTYLKKHPEIKKFWLVADERKRPRMPESFTLCQSDNFDHMNWFGDWSIKRIEEVEGEPVSLHV